ncbi:polysaccharide deacetylase family protein [uncultured Desulfovibrio sp.]|uniref:polysaccharide deacetylase family protein n=1 Tax=uncultured Desulfovibrio sp. TaxID=167968 RepID=UPI00260B95DC|nr:polysaccharide deacetylase family protein [uncultured Desulfovibrio sp.]
MTRLIFNEWLGIEPVLEVGNQGNWSISCEKHSATFPNIFFPEQSPETYFDPSRLKGQLLSHKICDYDMFFPFADNRGTSLASVDIFGSIFYFLACYEDVFYDHKEFNGTLAPSESFAYQNSLLDRPFIDEMIVQFVKHLNNHNINISFKNQDYQLIYSCDMDVPAQWYKASPFLFIKSSIASIIKHHSIRRFFSIFRSYTKVDDDIFYTFPWILTELEKNSLAGCFNLKGGLTNKRFDHYYDANAQWIQDILFLLAANGHEIGFHPSYDTPDHPDSFAKELAIVRRAAPTPVRGGRQHYLRFMGCSTWRMWDDAGLEYDSTVGFNKVSGFRLGTAREFPVYDLQHRKALKLRERPLIAMDCTLLGYEGATPQEAFDRACGYAQQIRKYGGNMTLLWHNSSLETPEKRELFSQLLKYLA